MNVQKKLFNDKNDTEKMRNYGIKSGNHLQENKTF